MTVIKIIPLLIYAWFFARFCLRLLEPRHPAYLTVGLFMVYEFVIDHNVISYCLKDFTSASLLVHIGFILLIILLFRGGIVKKIAIGVIGYAIYNLSAYLVLIPLFLAEGSSGLILTLIERSRFVLVVLLLEFISRKCIRLSGIRKPSATLLFPVLFVVLANELIYFAYQRIHLTPLIAMMAGRDTLPLHYYLDALLLLLTAASGLAVLLIVVFSSNAMLESELREQQLALQVEHYKALEQKTRHLAALRHDMKNHILSLQGLLSQGEHNQIARYLERMRESNAIAEPVIATGNSAVDAVLNEKLQQAAADGIDFQCDVRIPKSTRLDSFDLCVIIGNAVDNAIEACQKCDTTRYIHIRSGLVKSFLVLEVKNSTLTLSAETSTSDFVHHGIGLTNIRVLAEQSGGAMDITRDAGVFVLSVLLPV